MVMIRWCSPSLWKEGSITTQYGIFESQAFLHTEIIIHTTIIIILLQGLFFTSRLISTCNSYVWATSTACSYTHIVHPCVRTISTASYVYSTYSVSIFLRTVSTRTHQVFFPVFQVHFSMYKSPPEHIRYFPLSSKSLFVRTIPTRTRTSSIFPCPLTIFSCPPKWFGANNFKTIIEYLLRQMTRASLE